MIKFILAGVVIVGAVLILPLVKQPQDTMTMQQIRTEAAWTGPQETVIANAWFREGTMPSG